MITTWNTGRQYATEGQIITATQCENGWVVFVDFTRSVDGMFLAPMATSTAHLEALTMEYYDGTYRTPWEGIETIYDELREVRNLIECEGPMMGPVEEPEALDTSETNHTENDMQTYGTTCKETFAARSRDHNEHNDCAVWAVAAAARVSYDEAWAALAVHGRTTRGRTYNRMIFDALRTLGCDTYLRPHMSRFQMRSIKARIPYKGAWLVFMRGHVAAYVDREVIDWTEGRRHVVKHVYEVVRANKP